MIMCMPTCLCVCEKSEDNLQELIFFFCCLDFRDGTQVSSLAETTFTANPTNINFSR